MNVKLTCRGCDDLVTQINVDEQRVDDDIETIVTFLAEGLNHVLTTGHEIRLSPRDRLRLVGE
jgi:hypothetical protein